MWLIDLLIEIINISRLFQDYFKIISRLFQDYFKIYIGCGLLISQTLLIEIIVLLKIE